MKIIHVGLIYGSLKGGNPKHLRELSEALVRLGDDVTVFTTNAGKAKYLNKRSPEGQVRLSSEVINGIQVKRFKIAYNLHNFIFRKLPDIRGGYRLVNLLFNKSRKVLSSGPFVPQIMWHLLISRPDLVMVLNSWGSLSYFAYLTRKIIKFPLVIMPCLHTGCSWVEDPMIYRIMKSSDLVIAFTEFEKHYLIKNGVNENKIAVIGVGINPDDYQNANCQNLHSKYRADGELVVLFVGRREKDKGVETLTEAFELVWRHNKNIKLILAGNPSNNDKVFKDMIKGFDLELQKKIILIENFEEKEKSIIFASCDVFALPSKADSFGIVFLEAWLHKKPVIACKDTAQSSFINDGIDGLLVEYGNKDNLAKAILKLLENRDLRESMGLAGREKVLKNYTWDVLAKKVREKYHDVVNRQNEFNHAN